MGYFDDYQTKQNYSVNEIRRIGKDGVASMVTTTNDDYPVPAPGEKLVFFQGAGKPYTFTSRERNEKTGEFDEVEMIQLEFQVLTGQRKGDRFLIAFSTKVSDRSNLGKLSLATTGRMIGKVSDLLSEALRKPFYILTENDQKDNYVKVKFLSARPYDPAIDGPIGGQAATTPRATDPEPVAVAAGADDGADLFDIEL